MDTPSWKVELGWLTERMCHIRPGLRREQAIAAIEALRTLHMAIHRADVSCAPVDVPPAPQFAELGDRYRWRCPGGPGCPGWTGWAWLSAAAARTEYEDHVGRRHWGGTLCAATDTHPDGQPLGCVLGPRHTDTWHQDRDGTRWMPGLVAA